HHAGPEVLFHRGILLLVFLSELLEGYPALYFLPTFSWRTDSTGGPCAICRPAYNHQILSSLPIRTASCCSLIDDSAAARGFAVMFQPGFSGNPGSGSPEADSLPAISSL